jgi:hypothetical protein
MRRGNRARAIGLHRVDRAAARGGHDARAVVAQDSRRAGCRARVRRRVKRVVEAIVDQERGRLAAHLERAHALLFDELARVRSAGRAACRQVERVARVVVRLVHDGVGRLVAAIDRALHVVGRRGRRPRGASSRHTAFAAVTVDAVVAIGVGGARAARAIGFAAVTRHVVAVVAFLVALDHLVAAERPGVGVRRGIGLGIGLGSIGAGVRFGLGGVHVRGRVRRRHARSLAFPLPTACRRREPEHEGPSQ